MRGWVYVIKNKAIPDLLKIGFSTKDPILRAREFNGTGVPFDFEVLFDALVDAPRDVEQVVHRALFNQKENKEWFRCDLNQAIQEIRRAAGFIYREQLHSPKHSKQNNGVVFHNNQREPTSTESSDLEEYLPISSLKAKVLLRLIKTQLDDTLNAEIAKVFVKPLRFISLQVEELIHRKKVSYEEFSDLQSELERICYKLDPYEDELCWMLLSTATELCENILAGDFEVSDRIQTYLDHTEIVRIKLSEKLNPPPEKETQTGPPLPVATEPEAEPQRLPVGDSKCPSCRYVFPPTEITEFMDIWMRCPKCRQLMNID